MHISFLDECEYNARSSRVLVSSASHVDHDSSAATNSSATVDTQPPYVILDSPAATGSSASAAGGGGGRQMRQHKTTRVGGERLPHGSLLMSSITSRLTSVDRLMMWCCSLSLSLTCSALRLEFELAGLLRAVSQPFTR